MAEGSSDPPDLSLDEASHQKPYQHKPRRGRPRYNNDRNLNSYDPSQPYGHFQQGFKPPFNQDNSNYASHQHPPYQGEDGARRRGRGRGRREGNRGVNGSFGGSSSGWQRPGSDFGNNRGAAGFHSRAHPMDGPDGPSWRREDTGRNFEQSNEDPDAWAKKPRKFSQEQRRGPQNEKGTYFKENNTAVERSNDTKGENPPLDIRERSQRSRTGPIKPPKPLFQEETGSERGASIQDESGHGRSSQDPAFKAGRGSGRNTPLQARGGRRTHQNQRPGQRNWDKMPESKETQTGRLIEQLSEEKYECMVCCDVIRCMAPVWSCLSCFHVFHLNCIKKWARSPASQADDSAEGWRCPACQNVALKQPTSYTCFCGKVTNPEWQRSEIPHSCGDMCGKKRSGVDCNHPCNILCHPGPCPQCPAFITKSCICGKTSQPMRCGQGTVLQCDKVCAALLKCAKHTCSQVCHSGACQPCQLQVQQVCYCGVTTREVLCGTDKDGFDGSGLSLIHI